MSGALPWIGSYSALRRPVASGAPSEAEGSMPSEPVSIEASSDRMSPNRLSVTITSNWLGERSSCMASASAYMWLSATSEYFSLCSLVASSRHSTPVCMTLAFSEEQTLFLRLRASSKATAQTRRISLVL